MSNKPTVPETSSEKCLIDGLCFFFLLYFLKTCTNTSSVPRGEKNSPVDVSWADGLLALDSEEFRLNTATVEGSILSWVNSGVAIDLGTDDVSFLRSEHAHLTGSVSVCHLTANHPTMHD